MERGHGCLHEMPTLKRTSKNCMHSERKASADGLGVSLLKAGLDKDSHQEVLKFGISAGWSWDGALRRSRAFDQHVVKKGEISSSLGPG